MKDEEKGNIKSKRGRPKDQFVLSHFLEKRPHAMHHSLVGPAYKFTSAGLVNPQIHSNDNISIIGMSKILLDIFL